MPETPVTKIRIPVWIKKEVYGRTKNFSKYAIEAIIEKLNRTKN